MMTGPNSHPSLEREHLNAIHQAPAVADERVVWIDYHGFVARADGRIAIQNELRENVRTFLDERNRVAIDLDSVSWIR
jgi:hypothetical protein